MNQLLLAAFLLASPAMAQQNTPAAPTFPAPNLAFRSPNQGQNLQRALSRMATSTPQKRNKVRVLFYGQSITHGAWTEEVSKYLRATYPHADLEIENRALGGFASQVLIRPAEHDLYPFYPDLVIFHVYGSHVDYDEIIRRIRSRTTAEVLIHNDHYTEPSDWHDWFSHTWAPGVAARYGAEFADVRTAWHKYLGDNNLEPRALLSDAVHLNPHGQFLMAEVLKPYLRHNAGLLRPESTATVRDVPAKWTNGRLKMEFEGNRVDVVAAASTSTGRARVLIDGKAPSQFAEAYSFTRPSGTPHIGWPALIQVGSQSRLQVEDWTARLSDISPDGKTFKFEVVGSKTGPDGSGASGEKFVSRSGRVEIEPRNWWLNNDFELSKKPMPKTFEVKWRAVGHFADVYEAPKVEDASREYLTTLAQGLSNGRHTLELIAEGGEPKIEALRVYEPPVR